MVFHLSPATMQILLKVAIMLSLVKYTALYSLFKVFLISGKGYLFLIVRAFKLQLFTKNCKLPSGFLTKTTSVAAAC